jgi:hypothetical protein
MRPEQCETPPPVVRRACTRLEDGRLAVPRSTFRDWFMRWRACSTPEARLLKSRFSMTLANLEHAHVFIVPADLRILARSADRDVEAARIPRRGSPAIPADALYVGTYAHPFPADLFLADLAYVLTETRAA